MIEARLPEWAIWAGCPPPTQGELFDEYVRRLGLDPAPLLDGLTEQTLVLANYRLWSMLMRGCPEAFSNYLSARKADWL